MVKINELKPNEIYYSFDEHFNFKILKYIGIAHDNHKRIYVFHPLYSSTSWYYMTMDDVNKITIIDKEQLKIFKMLGIK